MWTIVIFLNENTIECVPENWLTSYNKCYWPPYKGNKLTASIACCQSPSSEWNIFPIRLLNEDRKYDDLLQARNACNKAQYSSDVSEFEGMKRKSKKKYLSSSSESEDSLKINVPTVPKHCFETKKEIGKSDHRQDSSLLEAQFKKNKCGSRKEYLELRSDQQQHIDKEVAGTIDNETATREFRVQVLRKLNMLNLKMDQLSTDILVLQQSSMAGETNFPPQTETDFNLPLQNFEAVDRMEESLRNEDYYRKFVAYLEKVGGQSEYECVKRIYNRVLTNEVAVSYNWLGLKKKKAFSGLILAKATKDAVLKNKLLEQATEKSVEMAMKNWLRHAKDRFIKGAENSVPPVPELAQCNLVEEL